MTLIWLTAGLASGLVAAAQENLLVNAFDSEEEGLAWSRWWGGATQTYEFDGAVDAAGSAASGSLKVTVDFDLAAFAGDNQFAARADFPGAATVDGTQYTNLTFKVRWASTSPMTSGGDFGYLEYGFRNADWSQTWLGGQSIPAGAGDSWVTIVAPIDPGLPKLDTVAGVVLKLWSGGGGGLTGSTTFWLDDVSLTANTDTTPPAPPTLRLLPATPGLRVAASSIGAQYQRQSLRTLAMDAEGNPRAYSWIGQSGPVTYSMTIREYPDAAHANFQSHLMLVPDSGLPYGAGDTSIDWNAPHTAMLHLANNADGTATAQFLYKTNLPGGNAMLWNTDPAAGAVGSLASISDASPLGTWSLTFRNDTEITLTTPSGLSTNFTMPAESAALFAEPLYAYFGAQPNSLANIGQAVTYSRLAISGVPTPLDDSFSGESLDTSNWAVVAADAPGLLVAPPTAVYWLTWGVPSTGFMVESTPQLGSGTWVDAGLSNVVQMGSEKRVVLPTANLPSPGAGFFRLIKP